MKLTQKAVQNAELLPEGSKAPVERPAPKPAPAAEKTAETRGRQKTGRKRAIGKRPSSAGKAPPAKKTAPTGSLLKRAARMRRGG